MNINDGKLWERSRTKLFNCLRKMDNHFSLLDNHWSANLLDQKCHIQCVSRLIFAYFENARFRTRCKQKISYKVETAFFEEAGSIDQFRPRLNERTCAINTKSRCNNFAINKGLLEKKPLAIESSIASLILKWSLSLFLKRQREREIIHVGILWVLIMQANLHSLYDWSRITAKFTRVLLICLEMTHSFRKRYSIDNNNILVFNSFFELNIWI